ncbi:MAG: hypothetical protein IPH07_00160 [Deltaproteobacteria bacterium]|nr:hypothetical protein [Deltaproteobacteria bacterium]MBK8717413.1 hypothetical protein [Deltaproteobacteria bacterium]MBP7286280.1 hypothetical protein [Nannocystaceae bacterium]
MWSGEHLELGTEHSLDEVCAGTLPWADRFVGYVGGVFGNPDAFVSTYWVDEDEIEEFCGPYSACAGAPEAFSQVVVSPHELTHAARGTAVPAQSPVEEGIAELYGRAPAGTYPLEGDVTNMLRDFGSGKLIPPELYGRAGHFASFVRYAYGEDALVALRATSDWNDDWPRTQEVFADALGEPLQTVVQRYESDYPDACDGAMFRDTNFDCLGEFIELSGADEGMPTVIEQQLACGDAEVFGVVDGRRRQTFRLHVQQSAWYHIVVETKGGTMPWNVETRTCGQSCMNYGDTPTHFDFGLIPLPVDPKDGDDVDYGNICVPAGDYAVVLETTATAEESPSLSLLLEFVERNDECVVR